jgi:hypothetical protein
MKNLLSTLFLSAIILGAQAQKGEQLNAEKELIDAAFHEIIRSMPSPILELEDLHSDKVKFNEHLLSPAANIEHYQSDAAEAINCGIYLVDLAYLSIFGEQDKMVKYRALALELADKINATEHYHNVLAIDLEKKVKDYSELKKAIDEALNATEQQLIDSNHIATASQMLLGSWVETQYIVLQSFMNDKKPSDEVKKHIMDQQVHLANLIKLVREFKDDAGLHQELEKLNILEASFLKIHNLDEVTEAIVMELVDEITRLRMDILAME